MVSGGHFYLQFYYVHSLQIYKVPARIRLLGFETKYLNRTSLSSQGLLSKGPILRTTSVQMSHNYESEKFHEFDQINEVLSVHLRELKVTKSYLAIDKIYCSNVNLILLKTAFSFEKWTKLYESWRCKLYSKSYASWISEVNGYGNGNCRQQCKLLKALLMATEPKYYLAINNFYNKLYCSNFS
ncbi:hypothetical protein CDAR_399372 [Caerostris darwini]|uniref:Uncharacterized protein n=1 Tax=Caerostris darwini TaxID=1538125 RepID=A0AAV4SVH6_9ARAC|nr:hypothetical protein CDAR_399372 [Caerostris darwini]